MIEDGMSDVIVREKSDYYARTADQMERHLSVPPWSIQQKMALTCRILAAEGHESALAGQITARGNRPGTYWMLSFGLGFDEATASNIVLVDDDLQLLEGSGMVNPSNRFHLWIYRHRPNVNAIVHTHPPYCSALSIVGQPLVAAHMDTAMFYDDCAFLAEWPGPPIGDEEGQIIHQALGEKRAVLLAHHGQLVATATIEEAAMLAVFIERAARMQVLAQSIGAIKAIDPAIAHEAHDYRLQPRAVAATFHYFARRVLRHGRDMLE
jgi:L-fuculose-phosphate aldolase